MFTKNLAQRPVQNVSRRVVTTNRETTYRVNVGGHGLIDSQAS